jgi:hypothetical protein
MSPGNPQAYERHVLADFRTYDQHADVVSAFEWMFTETKDLPDTVSHFERFPRVEHDGSDSSSPLTPDFTVLFNDNTAIVGEIAKIALHDTSVEKLCAQLGKYSTIPRIQTLGGGLVQVDHVDVMLLVEMKSGMHALNRVIKERYLDSSHGYKPSHPPCIVQFSRDESAYWFQRIPSPENGPLLRPGRKPNIADYLDATLNVGADRFYRIKAERTFINDEVTALYLASHLWTRTWPTQYGAVQGDIVVNPTEIAAELRKQFGAGRVADVKRALELLKAAGLAALGKDNLWTVSFRLLGRSGERDVHTLIAHRAAIGAKPLVRRRPSPPESGPTQDVLF